MSVKATTAVWEQSQGSGSKLLVLLALADHADDQGVCFPYIASLASKARCDEKTVRRVLRELQTEHEIDIWEWYEKRGGRKRNCYRIVVGELAAFRGIEPDEISARATLIRVNVPTAVRKAIFDRDGWRCIECGSKTDLEISHALPVTEGGGNEESNLRTICALCKVLTDNMSTREKGRDVHSEGDEMSTSHARDPLREPSIGTLKNPPSPHLVGRSNGPLNVLCEELGVDPQGPRVKQAVVALNGRGAEQGIRALFWLECCRYAEEIGKQDGLVELHGDPERFSQHLEAAIRRKVSLIREKQPWRSSIAPSNVRDLWLDIEKAQASGARGTMTPAEIEEISRGG